MMEPRTSRPGARRSGSRSCRVLTLLAATALVGGTVTVSGAQAQDAALERDPDSPLDEATGIRLPEGFQAEVFADGLGRARHVVVRENGDVYVALREPRDGGAIVALRDEDGDGQADEVSYFGEHGGGTGIGIREGWLYASSDTTIYRFELPDEDLVPERGPEVVVEGFPEQQSHASKAFTLDDAGNLYVNVGAPSNACQEEDRTVGSPGQDPCPLLEHHAGIWRFDADKAEQSFDEGTRFVTAVRNVVALDWKAATGELYFVQHGRDQLHELYPELYTEEQSAELPAEELHVAREGANYGWPYGYWDPEQGQRMLAPEYGGDGATPVESALYDEPLLALPAHWAPNDLLFYDGGQFPAQFQDGALIAFHGSWNREPFAQQGYNVVLVPFDGANPAGGWHVFADGFEGAEEIAIPTRPGTGRWALPRDRMASSTSLIPCRAASGA